MRILQTVLFKQAPKGEKNASQTDALISTVCGVVRLSDKRGVVVEERTRLQHRSNCFCLHEGWRR